MQHVELNVILGVAISFGDVRGAGGRCMSEEGAIFFALSTWTSRPPGALNTTSAGDTTFMTFTAV